LAGGSLAARIGGWLGARGGGSLAGLAGGSLAARTGGWLGARGGALGDFSVPAGSASFAGAPTVSTIAAIIASLSSRIGAGGAEEGARSDRTDDGGDEAGGADGGGADGGGADEGFAAMRSSSARGSTSSECSASASRKSSSIEPYARLLPFGVVRTQRFAASAMRRRWYAPRFGKKRS
jgi:hypothetical protein